MSKRQYVEEILQDEPLAPEPVRRRSMQDDYLDELGREKPDPTPMAPPIGYNPQPSLAETIRNMVLSERLKQEALAAGAETFEEADDFDIGDDYDPTSPYEELFDPPIDPYQGLREAVLDGMRQSQQTEPAAPAAEPPAAAPSLSVDNPI